MAHGMLLVGTGSGTSARAGREVGLPLRNGGLLGGGEAEEGETVPPRAGYLAGDRAERLVEFAIVHEAGVTHVHADPPSFVIPAEHRARHGKSRVARGIHAGNRRMGGTARRRAVEDVLWRANPQVGILRPPICAPNTTRSCLLREFAATRRPSSAACPCTAIRCHRRSPSSRRIWGRSTKPTTCVPAWGGRASTICRSSCARVAC